MMGLLGHMILGVWGFQVVSLCQLRTKGKKLDTIHLIQIQEGFYLFFFEKKTVTMEMLFQFYSVEGLVRTARRLKIKPLIVLMLF